jgi:hypothetical protein
MDESALLNQLKTLESAWGSLDHWLNFWVALVVIGVAMEVVVIVIEYRHELHAFNRGIIRPPDRPSRWLFGFGLLGAGLVAIGVAGEFWLHIKAGKLESEMREANRQLVALVNQRAADAGERASKNELARVKIEASVAWRRLSKKQQSTIADHLKRFAGLKVVLEYIGGDPEALLFAEDIAAALRAAKCQVPPIQPFSLFGGYGGGVYPLHSLTGVSLARTKNRLSRDAHDAIQRELCSMGFDATITTDKLEPEVDVLVVARPDSPQGLTELKINAKTPTRTCAASP